MNFLVRLAAMSLFIATTALQAWAYDFTIDSIAYAINADSATVTVTSTHRLSADNYSGLRQAVIPQEVTPDSVKFYVVDSIDDFAFYGCSTLTAVTIPASVKQIGDRAFAKCPELTAMSVDRRNNVYDSRSNCNAIVRKTDNTVIAACSATTLNNVMSAIGPYAFYGCSKLENITISSPITKIGYEAFGGCTSLRAITIPANMTELGYRAFAGCDELSTIIVSANNSRYDSRDSCNAVIETATNTLVAGCSTTVIPSTVDRIGYEAFSGASISKMVIPETVTGIGHYAFRETGALKTVDIPSQVNRFGDRAFADCINLRTIYARLENPATADYYDFSTFEGVDTTTCTLYVPEGTVPLYSATLPWSPFIHIETIPEWLPGDVNADGNVDITDVNILINIILGRDEAENYERRAYILGNDDIDISDVNALINLVLY